MHSFPEELLHTIGASPHLMKMHLLRLFSGLIGFALPCLALAQTLLPNPSILSYAAASGDRPVTNIFDGNPNTDYATDGLGTSTYISFDFGTAATINGFMFQQRSNVEQVASFDLLFSNSTSFSTPIATYHLTPNLGIIASTTFSFDPVTAEYVQWQVTGTSGGTSSGATEMAFYGAIPEPASYASLAGLAALALVVTRRRRA